MWFVNGTVIACRAWMLELGSISYAPMRSRLRLTCRGVRNAT
jgi:hypothetical protein